jgi:flagellar biosynthetic protein FliQ
MNPEVAIDLFKSTVVFALWIVAPFLIAMLLIGLVTSLIQSVTSIQEQTLSFAPKLVALAGLSLLVTPWLLRSLTEFTVAMLARMATLAH